MSMTIKEAIREIEEHIEVHHIGEWTRPKVREALNIALATLQEKAERENPKPLTLEELRQFEGMPVYLVCESIDVYEWQILDFSGSERTGFRGGLRFLNEVYGIAWLAYRHKPKEVPLYV